MPRNNLWLNGQVYSDEDGAYLEQVAPAADTTTAFTFAAATMAKTKLQTCSNTSAVTATLPTGAVLDAYFGDLPNNASFDWSLINLGSSSGAATVTAATGHTIVGAAVVAIATTGVFRTRKVSDGVFVTYRIG